MRGLRRTKAAYILSAGCLILVLLTSAALAQDAGTRALTPGSTVSGTLDGDNLAQVYTYDGIPGEAIQLSATTGPGVALLLTDSAGNGLAQAKADFTGPSGAIEVAPVTLVDDGVYYVTVFVYSDSFDEQQGAFDLTLTVAGEVPITIPPSVSPVGQVITTSGMQVTLTWDTTADMNLQVRDPLGGDLFWDSRATDDGGSFGFDANGLCEVLTETPVETATWPAGALATGSYEVLVYYRSTCEDEGPVTFTIDVTVDGVPMEPIEGTLAPPTSGQDQVFITSFVVQLDGTAVAGANGVYTGVLGTAVSNLPQPTPIERDVPVEAAINSQEPYQTYSFVGQANELVSIDVSAISGSLDTLLYILGPSGSVVYSNDDVQSGITDSALSNIRLAVDGTYTIVVTRYGQTLGGTEGRFELLFTGPTGDLPPELQALSLPEGDVEVTLLWNTNADLQLLVRDPSGDSVFDDIPTIPSGGRLAASGNVNCTVSATQPVSYIYWPKGFLRAGTYEVDVWYQNNCGDDSPVEFTLIVKVDGEVVLLDTARPIPNDQYVSSFNIDVNRQVTVYGGGIMGLSAMDYTAELSSAPEAAIGRPTLGSISFENPFDVYVFEGESGDVLNISMNQVSGNLDTMLFVLDPNGNLLQSNDDAVVGEVTDSLVSDLSLGQDGRYIILATRFGILYGATTGGYELTITRRN